MLILLADLEGLLQDVLVADDAHIWILWLVLVLDDLLGLVDGHLLDHVGQELHSLIRREHLGAYRLALDTTSFSSSTDAHSARIQRALHEFATLGREFLARHLHILQIRIDLSSDCREQVAQLVHLELHL